MGNSTIKAIYILSIIVYCAVGFCGDFLNAYVEQTSKDKAMSKYLWQMIVVSLAIGITIFVLFKKAFPRGYEKQNSLSITLIFILFMILPYPFIRGYALLINEVSTKKSVTINGNVKEKYIKESSKGWRTYFVVVENEQKTWEYEFEVKRSVYDRTPDSAVSFNKEFTMGALGIVYRKDF